MKGVEPSRMGFWWLWLMAFVIAGALWLACTNDVSGPGSDVGNSVQNPSFESGGQPSFRYWQLKDTVGSVQLQFAQEAPAGGGSWSLRLDPNAGDEWARYYLRGPAPKYVYHLTFWAKTVGPLETAYGALGLRSLARDSLLQSTTVSGQSWQYYNVYDTLSLSDTDSLFVQLGAGTSSQAAYALFDVVRLEKYK